VTALLKYLTTQLEYVIALLEYLDLFNCFYACTVLVYYPNNFITSHLFLQINWLLWNTPNSFQYPIFKKLFQHNRQDPSCIGLLPTPFYFLLITTSKHSIDPTALAEVEGVLENPGVLYCITSMLKCINIISCLDFAILKV